MSVPAFLRDELAEHLARPLAGGQTAEAFIFTTPTGEPVRHNNFYKPVFLPAVVGRPERPAKSAKQGRGATPARPAVPGALNRSIRFHDLRHTCAALLIAAGAHPLQIKTRLGHEDIRTTMNTYGHLFPSAEAAMADLLDAGYRAAGSSGDTGDAVSLR